MVLAVASTSFYIALSEDYVTILIIAVFAGHEGRSAGECESDVLLTFCRTLFSFC